MLIPRGGVCKYGALLRNEVSLTACAPRGPQKGDQQQHRGGPLKPDFVEAAEDVDRKQEDGDGDQHDAGARQARVPAPDGSKAR
jgi:hypothetical protein